MKWNVQKTGLKRAQPNPLYKETFIFQVALFQLGDVHSFYRFIIDEEAEWEEKEEK